MATEPTTDAEEQADSLKEQVGVGGGIPGLPEWAFAAYKAHMHRGQAIAELARVYGVAWQTVKSNVEKVHALVVAIEDSDVLTASAKYKGGLRETLACLWRDYTTATHDSAKVGFLKQVSEVLKQIAAAEGIATERKDIGLHGVDGKPPIEFSWWRGIEAAQQQSGDVQEETDGSGSGEG